MSAGGRSGTEGFKSYADVQAALDREYVKGAGQSAEGVAARNWWYEQQTISSSMVSRAAPAASGGNPAPAPAPPPPPPAPVLPTFKPMTTSNSNIKVAPSDIIQFDDSSIEIALISDLLFEDIGATELANISRSDLIDGQDVVYAPIKNLSTIRREFNPNNIVANSFFDDYFSRFGINLSLRGVREPYFNDDGDLVIQIDTVLSGEEVQVQVLSSGTIYMVDDK